MPAPQQIWSIGIYTGPSPFDLKPSAEIPNPVLTRESVTDVAAAFVADPFMIRGHMFFEVMNHESNRGEIGLASSSNGFYWKYERIVLRENFHLSYPYVFEWQNAYYMIPESLRANAAWLYRAEEFPSGWTRAAKLIDGPCADPSIVRFHDLWWLFLCPVPYRHDTLRLYFAEELTGPWREHPKSPIIAADNCRARPAGRLLVLNDKVIRFAQECVPHYGTRVRAFDILELTTTTYREVENAASPILQPGDNEWNSAGMHHVDAHQQPNGTWLACVDGFKLSA
ncbi:MAG TPA: hypothetical protein VFT02_03755 [Pyrinomonadaceae bacterium]|nr:hypothetical protein [Pyrinomonadaceae bacterium]